MLFRLAPQVGLARLRSGRVAVEYAKGHILCAAPFESYILQHKNDHTFWCGHFYGASSRTRTYDPAVNSRMLYRLSY